MRLPWFGKRQRHPEITIALPEYKSTIQEARYATDLRISDQVLAGLEELEVNDHKNEDVLKLMKSDTEYIRLLGELIQRKRGLESELPAMNIEQSFLDVELLLEAHLRYHRALLRASLISDTVEPSLALLSRTENAYAVLFYLYPDNLKAVGEDMELRALFRTVRDRPSVLCSLLSSILDKANGQIITHWYCRFTEQRGELCESRRRLGEIECELAEKNLSAEALSTLLPQMDIGESLPETIKRMQDLYRIHYQEPVLELTKKGRRGKNQFLVCCLARHLLVFRYHFARKGWFRRRRDYDRYTLETIKVEPLDRVRVIGFEDGRAELVFPYSGETMGFWCGDAGKVRGLIEGIEKRQRIVVNANPIQPVVDLTDCDVGDNEEPVQLVQSGSQDLHEECQATAKDLLSRHHDAINGALQEQGGGKLRQLCDKVGEIAVKLYRFDKTAWTPLGRCLVTLEFDKEKTDAILVIRDHESKVQRVVSRLRSVAKMNAIGDNGLAFVETATNQTFQMKLTEPGATLKGLIEAWDYVQTCDYERQIWRDCDHPDQSELFVAGECRLLFIPKRADSGLQVLDYGTLTVKDSFKFELNTAHKMHIGWIRERIDACEFNAFYGAMLNDSRQTVTWGIFVADFYYSKTGANFAAMIADAEYQAQPLDLVNFLNYRNLAKDNPTPDYSTPFEQDLELTAIFVEREAAIDEKTREKIEVTGCLDIVNEPFEMVKSDRLLTFGLFD